MKVLITGINGFVGSHLAELSLRKGDMVYGLTNEPSNSMNLVSILDKIFVYEADLRSQKNLSSILRKIKPQIIYHLAGIKSGSLEELTQINAFGTANLFKACLESGINPRILVIGSSSQYGVGGKKKYSEVSLPNPKLIYGVSKCVQDLVCSYYLNNSGLKVLRAVPFNHIGPREPENLLASYIAKQVGDPKKIERELKWRRSISLKRSVVDLIDYWKKRSEKE